MQVVVTKKLYGYMDTNTINEGKRDEIVKKFYKNKYVNTMLKKKMGIPCHEHLWFIYIVDY